MIKLIIAVIAGCLEWMFIGMTFFIDWNPFLVLGILFGLGYTGFFCFISWWKDWEVVRRGK